MSQVSPGRSLGTDPSPVRVQTRSPTRYHAWRFLCNCRASCSTADRLPDSTRTYSTHTTDIGNNRPHLRLVPSAAMQPKIKRQETESCWGRCQGDAGTWCRCLHVKVDERWMTSSSRENARDVENVGKDVAIIFLTASCIYDCLKRCARDLPPNSQFRLNCSCMLSDCDCKSPQQCVLFCPGTCCSSVSVWALPKLRKEWKFYGSSVFRAAVDILFDSCLWRFLQYCRKLEKRYLFLTKHSIGPACGRSTWNSIFVRWS